MPEITVPVPQGVVVPDDAVQVPNSFLIWRDGLTVVAVLPTGGVVVSDPYPSEVEAVAVFVHFAYMH